MNPPPKSMGISLQFSGDLFLVVTRNLTTFFNRHSPASSSCGPLCLAFSCVSLPLHQHIRPLTTNGPVHPVMGPFYPLESPTPVRGSGVVCPGSAHSLPFLCSSSSSCCRIIPCPFLFPWENGKRVFPYSCCCMRVF